MIGALVGRDAVLAAAGRTLDASGAVLLEGVAGIGKTAVLTALTERAAAAGVLVVGCAPTEAETELPLAALADVLAPLAERIDSLPAPQRSAVEAVLVGAGSGPGVDEHALAAATRALLEDAVQTSGRSVLVSVDDAPWLDPPSERALRFALRRLAGRLAVLVSRRTEDVGASAVPLGLDGDRLAPPGGPGPSALTRLALEPLGPGPLHHVLGRRFEVALSRPMLARLARDSGGNPLLAIELTRAMLRLPTLPGPGDDLPVTTSLQELVVGTLDVLPEAGRTAVRLAALHSTPNLRELAAAGVRPEEFDAAEEAGLVRVGAGGRIEFVHPVHAAAIRAAIPPGVRHRLHRTLAAVSSSPDERARHLARSTTDPDPDVAATLAAAAERARTRGAPELAADFFQRAAALTPAAHPDEQQQRRLLAARARYDSGDYAVAGAQADVLALELTGDARVEALLLRAAVAWSADDPPAAVDAATRALAVARPESRLAGRVHAHLAVFVDLPAPARQHAEQAMRLLSEGDDPTPEPGSAGVLAADDRSLLASALMLLFLNEVRGGAPARLDLLDQALALEGSRPTVLAGTVPAIWWKGVDEHARAITRLTALLDHARERGEEPFAHELMTHLGETELLAGHFAAADEWIARSRTLGEQLATSLAEENWLAAMLNAHRGDLEAAERAAQLGLAQAARTGESWLRRVNLQLAGLAALEAGRPGEAAGRFADLAAEVDAGGMVEPLGSRFEADWVEACVASGDLGTASAAQARLAARHGRLPRAWTALGLARGAVLIAAADGQPTEPAVRELEAARRAVPADVLPLDRARCLLVIGLAHRRARRKQPARAALEAAAAEFAALGARAWEARARAELARVGGARGAPTAPADLSPTERRVAILAAEGNTNRAIADALFVSPKTVEANLARVYRKLGITSRAQLGTALAALADEA